MHRWQWKILNGSLEIFNQQINNKDIVVCLARKVFYSDDFIKVF